MMQYSSDPGWSAYWMLHSPTMPKCRTTLMAVALSLKYSRLLKVWDGATTMESPVCTPKGSKFSMLHTVMQLSLASRTTSYSTSFHPRRSWSIRIWSDTLNAFSARSLSSTSLSAKPDPSPPNANAARTNTGYPILAAASHAWSMVTAGKLSASVSSISASFSANISRSSVATITGIWVPNTRTLCFARSPFSKSFTPTLRAVCPPMDTRMESGFSFSITRRADSLVTGKKYTWSAQAPPPSPCEVCTVAMFGLMSTTSIPSSFSALMAWEPL
mmetsp:Transcript_44556/g.90013  ORF Transcript_44556/g.90013 Transcript_44556/m.90013 type:complete len:273 (+) Transcript_44556:2650-3468(+)